METSNNITVNEEIFIENNEPEESEVGQNTPSKDIISQAVVSATDWTTETILNQINKGNIQLNPIFQRRDAWEQIRKSGFIESLFLGLPVPQIVLAESKTRKGSYIVIDGKQRLLSIRQFAALENDNDFKQLKLKGLAICLNLNRKSYTDLKDDSDFFDDVSAFENQTIRTVVIKNWRDENFLYEVFLRLNTGSVPLSPQELRQALLPGPFTEFIDIASGESPSLRELLKISKPDFRMRDAELLLRFFAFKKSITNYRGNLKVFLDDTCKFYNSNWHEKEEEVQSILINFELAYKTSVEIFGVKNVFRKWTRSAYEKPFNRAIFDIIMFHFSNEDIRKQALKMKEQIEEGFKNLCTTNQNFQESIERTTKSIGSTSLRLNLWTQKLNTILGTQIPLPFEV